mmetsp:Transcript_20438/g.17786  ORF Transcript_20438/g.17786 Transcript_20438/m.17786 type:complete len:174 (+) Transcript_20438:2360-2881(+)
MLKNYESYGIDIPKEYKIVMSESNLNSLSYMLTKFYQKEKVSDSNFAPLNDSISLKKAENIINMAEIITYSDNYDVTLDSAMKLVEDSFSLTERINTKLTVQDLINMRNYLTSSNSKEIFCGIRGREGSEDPLKIISDALYTGSEIETGEFSMDILTYKVNLKISSKLLHVHP